jgi:hypothetical protein
VNTPTDKEPAIQLVKEDKKLSPVEDDISARTDSGIAECADSAAKKKSKSKRQREKKAEKKAAQQQQQQQQEPQPSVVEEVVVPGKKSEPAKEPENVAKPKDKKKKSKASPASSTAAAVEQPKVKNWKLVAFLARECSCVLYFSFNLLIFWFENHSSPNNLLLPLVNFF